MPSNLTQVGNAIKNALIGGNKKLLSGFKNVDDAVSAISNWGSKNGYSLTKLQAGTELQDGVLSLIDDYGNRGFNAFTADVEKRLGAALSSEEKLLLQSNKDRLYNTDWTNSAKNKKFAKGWADSFKATREGIAEDEAARQANINNLQQQIELRQNNILAVDNSQDYALELEALKSSNPADLPTNTNVLKTVPENQRTDIKDIASVRHANETTAFQNSSSFESQGGLFDEFSGQIPEESVGTVVEAKNATIDSLPNIPGVDANIKGETVLFDAVNTNSSLIEQARERALRKKNGTLSGVQQSNRIRIEAAEDKLRSKSAAVRKQSERQAAKYDQQQLAIDSDNPYDKIKARWGQTPPAPAEPPINENTAWGSTAKAALGTAVGGAALMAALSGSRGQQNNAQLYGQQPLY